MSHPDDEQLADAALGIDELTPGVHQHLDRCQECARTTAELRRTAVLLAGADSAAVLRAHGEWESPPPRVWDRIATAVAGDVPGVGQIGRRGVDQPTRQRGRAWPWVVGLAAAGLVAGLLTGRAVWDEAVPSARPIAQAELDTLDTQQRLGEATVVRTDSGVQLEVATTSALDQGDGYLEVWLINSDGKRMVSIGVLDAKTGQFPISQDLLDQGYVVVDISREGFDDRPEHSGDSLLRGTLPA
jgi:hypothetical protein